MPAVTRRARRPLIGVPSAAPAARADSSEPRGANESTEATDPAEPIENAEATEPAEQMLSADPVEPIERIEPSLAIESTEFRLRHERTEDSPLSSASLTVPFRAISRGTVR